jgi:hypothetical protein
MSNLVICYGSELKVHKKEEVIFHFKIIIEQEEVRAERKYKIACNINMDFKSINSNGKNVVANKYKPFEPFMF